MLCKKMSIDLIMLVLSAVLALVYVNVQGAVFGTDVGQKIASGPRDALPEISPLAGRAERALRNFLETYPVFIALIVVIEFAQRGDWFTLIGGVLYLVTRTAFLPLYLAGTPGLRSLSWVLSILGLLLMIVGIVF